MVNSALIAGTKKPRQALKCCPRCGSWRLFFYETEDNEWWCFNCGRRFDVHFKLIGGEATSAVEQPADPSPYKAPEVMSLEVKLEPSSRVPMTHTERTEPEGDNAKALTSGRLANKRQEEGLPTRYIYRFSVDGAWFSPGEITFRPEHILFLIRHLQGLRLGIYPPDPNKGSSGYTEAPVSKGRRYRRAYFEMPAGLAGEVSARLLSCGLAGLLLEAYHCWGLSSESLSKYTGLVAEVVERRISQALNYVSGFRRKNYSFAEFVGHRRERKGNGRW